MDYFTIL